MTITDLIEKLEKAEGPNYRLDIEIFKFFNPEYADYVEGRGGLVHVNDGEDQRVLSNVRAPNYTASLDAAVALAESALPGWRNSSIKTDDGEYAAYAWLPGADGPFRVETHAEHIKSSRAIALCLAILRAKAAQGGDA
jgi:hypothetical protein